MKSFQLTKSIMINWACDTLGYSESDFQDQSFEEIKSIFTTEQLQDCINYHTGY